VTSSGTCMPICVGDAYRIGARVPFNVTSAPSSMVLSFPLLNAGKQVGCRHDVPSVKLVPKMAAMLPADSGAAPDAKLALFTMPFELMDGPEGGCCPLVKPKR